VIKIENIKIHERIKKIRTNNKLSQKEFAEKIGIGQSSISELEKGNAKPSVETLESISKNFKISIDYIVHGEEYSQKNNENKNEISTKETNIINTYRKLDIEGQARTRAYMDFVLMEQVKNEKEIITEKNA
jgi:transcriptional regulator with XRE-family HTH domain